MKDIYIKKCHWATRRGFKHGKLGQWNKKWERSYVEFVGTWEECS